MSLLEDLDRPVGAAVADPEPNEKHQPSVLEKLQRTNELAEIWWDSPPLDFPAWREQLLATAPDAETRRRWSTQLTRFLAFDDPSECLVRGVTTNPSLISKSVLASPETWGREIRRQATQQRLSDPEAIYTLIYREAVERSANAMMPMWQHSHGQYGWVSAQLDPRTMFAREKMLDEALQLVRLSPNIMVKVPGTAEGYATIAELVGRGISINNTLSYTVPQFVECIRAVEQGLETAHRNGVDTQFWRAVVTHMIGRFGAHGDLAEESARRGIELSAEEVRWAEVTVLKEIDTIIRENRHPVKMLLSSLETENPMDSSVLSMHLQQTAGADVVYTCKPDFIEGLMRRDTEISEFRPDAIDEPVPAEVRARLEQLPYFRRAVTPDGMRPEEFASHGAFVSTHAEVNHHTRKLIDFIAHQIEDLTATARDDIQEARP